MPISTHPVRWNGRSKFYHLMLLWCSRVPRCMSLCWGGIVNVQTGAGSWINCLMMTAVMDWIGSSYVLLMRVIGYAMPAFCIFDETVKRKLLLLWHIADLVGDPCCMLFNCN